MKKRNLFRKIRRALAVRLRQNLWLMALSAAALSFGLGVSDADAVTINLSPQKRASDGTYNFRLGDNIKFNFAGSMTVQWSDNIDRSNNDGGNSKVAGWFVEPGLSMAVYWPVSPFMDISSGIGVSYRYYPDDSGENNWEITGDGAGTFNTNIALQLKLGQTGTLNLSDTLTRNIDSLAIDNYINNDSQNVDKYSSTKNVLALDYAVDLNEFTNAKAHYDHTNVWTSPKKYDYQNYQSDTGDVVLLRDLNQQVQAGPYATVVHTYYSNGDPGNGGIQRDDTMLYSTGLAMTYRRAAGFTADARVGWTLYHPLSDNFNNGNSDNSSLTYSLSVNFATSEVLLHTISSSYGYQQDYMYSTVAYSKTWTNAYAVSWRFARDWTLNGDLAWQQSDEAGPSGNNSDFYRAGIGTGYKFAKNTDVSFRYEYAWRTSSNTGNSNVNNGEYTRNTVTVTLTHKF